MTRVAVVGASGYAGRELLQLLARHDDVTSITAMSARAGGEPTRLDARGERTAVPLAVDALGRDHDVVIACAARYGLTEHEREALAGARLVANPGCYPTATLLALLPLVKDGLVAAGSRVVVDAKSGVSGAGKSPTDITVYGNVNETFRAYGVGNHRHAPEIESRLEADLSLSFVPHLVPMFRGMLATVFV